MNKDNTNEKRAGFTLGRKIHERRVRTYHPLSKREEEQISELVNKEDQFLKETYSKLNGGFYESHVFNYDDDYIDVEFKFGVQNGGPDDRTTTEQAKINRKTMKWED